MSKSYLIGNRARLTCQFTNAAGTPTAPSSVSISVRRPDGSRLTPTALSGTTTGEYYAEIDLTMAGTWYYRFEASGTLIAAAESQLIVKASAL